MALSMMMLMVMIVMMSMSMVMRMAMMRMRMMMVMITIMTCFDGISNDIDGIHYDRDDKGLMMIMLMMMVERFDCY